MSEQAWFVRHQGAEHGPFSPKELKKLAEAGRITAETLVCLDRSGNWKPASKVSGLFVAEPPPVVAELIRGSDKGVQFLKTTGVSHHLQQIVDEATEFLYLISPFLKIAERLRQAIEERDQMKIDIRVIYGKSELTPDQLSWLHSRKSLRASFCESLHAKCYMNEKEALVTSMNLYEFSQVNNHEMGILVEKSGSPALYAEILDEARRLLRISEVVVTKSKLPKILVEAGRLLGMNPDADAKPQRPTSASENCRTGFCIRCRKTIADNPSAPYCSECFRIWKKYENPTYAEKHCHCCGKEHASTFKKPLCVSCYKKFQ